MYKMIYSQVIYQLEHIKLKMLKVYQLKNKIKLMIIMKNIIICIQVKQ
jgi:hypothetical protein